MDRTVKAMMIRDSSGNTASGSAKVLTRKVVKAILSS
jgi:hypothetical protein